MTRSRSWKCLAVLLLPCVLASRGAAQDVYTWTDQQGVVHFSDSAPAQGTQATVTHSGGQFRAVPLENENNRKLVRVELQGTDQTSEISMVVDTGAQKTMIDATVARQIGVNYLRGQLIGGVTGVGVGALVEVPRLKIGSAELRNVDVIVGPASGVSLLGMDVLNKLDLSVGQNSLYRERSSR